MKEYTKKQAIDLFNTTAVSMAMEHPNQVLTEEDVYIRMLQLGRKDAVVLLRGWA